jgi:hypothetical protein
MMTPFNNYLNMDYDKMICIRDYDRDIIIYNKFIKWGKNNSLKIKSYYIKQYKH